MVVCTTIFTHIPTNYKHPTRHVTCKQYNQTPKHLNPKQVAGGGAKESSKGSKELVLVESHVLGGGAFSRVSLVSGMRRVCCIQW